MLKESRYLLPFGQLSAIETDNKNTAEISVVFLHGWLDNAASFSTVLHHLHEQAPHLHLCAIDLPGHGFSGHKGQDNFYPFHDYIDDIDQFLSILSPNRLVLVGHSLGALIASCYSAVFPQQVAALVQIEGFGPLAECEENTIKRLREGIRSRSRIRKKPQRHLPSIAEVALKRSRINHVSIEAIMPIVERGTYQTSKGHWQWRHDRKLQAESLYRMSFLHAREFLDQVTCPQLVILGSRGFETIKTSLPASKKTIHLVEINGAHHCHLEQPVRVVDLIFGLVNKI